MSSCEASIVPEIGGFRKGGGDQSITASWPSNTELADDPVEVDAELVGQAQHLAVADVQDTGDSPG